ncbi:MAG: tagaturonate reductase, partial [Bacteroidetes bacterium]
DTPSNEVTAKRTLWVYLRFLFFQGHPDKGCIMIPVELIPKNGEMLQKCILQNIDNWGLKDDFRHWIVNHNIFCNTLVDRIVPGVGRELLSEEWEKLGYQDTAITQGEAFHFWVIEGPEIVQEELPLDKAGLNVIFTHDLTPYRTRKVRILNGAHTSMVPVGYLYGTETVRKTVEHEVMGKFVLKTIFEEIIPTLDLPDDELRQYANDVLDRFKNPFIKHQLISIALNSVSKFETRVLPSLLEYYNRKGMLPINLVFSLAALLTFYKGTYRGKTIPLNDDPEAIAFLADLWQNCDGSEESLSELAEKVLGWEYAWKKDLNSIDGLKEMLADHLSAIEVKGIQQAVADIL